MSDQPYTQYPPTNKGVYTGKELLWVDREHTDISGVWNRLRNYGLNIVGTRSVASATAYLQVSNPHYLVSAILSVDNDAEQLLSPLNERNPNLPGLDFIAFARTRYPKLPIGVFTAVADYDTIHTATKKFSLSFWEGKGLDLYAGSFRKEYLSTSQTCECALSIIGNLEVVDNSTSNLTETILKNWKP